MVNKKLKKFIFSGLIGIAVLIIYEIIIVLLSGILNLYVLILGWAPFFLGAILFDSIFFMIFFTIILVFIIGGCIGLFSKKFKK